MKLEYWLEENYPEVLEEYKSIAINRLTTVTVDNVLVYKAFKINTVNRVKTVRELVPGTSLFEAVTWVKQNYEKEK